MPTFDFFNVVRKIVSSAISVACSPVSAVLAGAALLSTFLDSIVSFFGENLTLPNLSLRSIPEVSGSSDWLSLFLYAVNFDSLVQILNPIISFVSSFIDFGVRFLASLLLILVTVGSYRVVRAALKDYI